MSNAYSHKQSLVKSRSVILIILVAIITLYGITHVIAKQKLRHWIESNDSITVKDTKLNLLMGNVRLLESIIFHKSSTTDTCTINLIKIEGFSLLDFLLNSKINIDEIKFDGAELFLTKPPKPQPRTHKRKKLLIGKISSKNLNIHYSTEKFSLEAIQVNTIISNVTDASKFNFEDIEFSIKDFVYKPNKGTHNFLVENVELSRMDNKFTAANLFIQPKCGIDEWASCYPNKKARSAYQLRRLHAELDTNYIMSGMFLRELEIEDGTYSILTFKEMKSIESPKAYFMKKFNEIAIPINIPIIKVKNHKVEALMKDEKVDTISFEKIYATFTNVTNIPSAIEKNHYIKVTTLSKFMDAKLKVDFDFKLKDSLNAYSFNLDLSPMPFTNLNKALNYNTPLEVEKGELQKLGCAVRGNNLTTFGQCDIAYKDLYVSIENQEGITKKLFTKILNLVVKDGTEKNDKMTTKTYSSTLERDPNKEFFYHAYTTILQNINQALLPL